MATGYEYRYYQRGVALLLNTRLSLLQIILTVWSNVICTCHTDLTHASIVLVCTVGIHRNAVNCLRFPVAYNFLVPNLSFFCTVHNYVQIMTSSTSLVHVRVFPTLAYFA